MKPFLLNKVFEVNPDIQLRRLPVAQVPGVVIDNLLMHPREVHDIACETPAANWKNTEGGHNFVDYYDCRLRFPMLPPNDLVAVAQQVIKSAFGADTRPQQPSIDVNWFMQIRERRADFAVPHHDLTEDARIAFTCLLYINAPAECSGGTAFFRFRETDSLVPDPGYTRALQRGNIAETGDDYWLRTPDPYWEHVGSIDMAPGRLVIFPANYFHAAHHPRDSFFEFPRLTLVFWMVAG